MGSDLLLAIFYVAANAAWQPFALAAVVRIARHRLAPDDLHVVTLFSVLAAALLPFASALLTVPASSLGPLRGPSTATFAVTATALVYAALVLAAVVQWSVRLARALRLRRSASGTRDLLRGAVATPLTIVSSIMVPNDFETWPRDVREWCLAHEHAHVVHHDWWWNVAIRLVASPLSFHPAGRWLLRELEIAREESRDAQAAGNHPLGYAEALLFVADRLADGQDRGVALTLGTHSALERRCERLIHPRLPSRPFAGLLATGIVALILFATRVAAPHLTAAAIAGQWVSASGELPVALDLHARGEQLHGFVRFDAIRLDADQHPVRIRTDVLPVTSAAAEPRLMQLSAPPTLLSLEPTSANEAILRNRNTGAEVLMKRTASGDAGKLQ